MLRAGCQGRLPNCSQLPQLMHSGGQSLGIRRNMHSYASFDLAAERLGVLIAVAAGTLWGGCSGAAPSAQEANVMAHAYELSGGGLSCCDVWNLHLGGTVMDCVVQRCDCH